MSTGLDENGMKFGEVNGERGLDGLEIGWRYVRPQMSSHWILCGTLYLRDSRFSVPDPHHAA